MWDNTDAKGAELLVLLALADHADDDGNCYPSMTHIAKKARLTVRGVRKAMRSLESKKLLSCKIGAGPGKVNRYKVGR